MDLSEKYFSDKHILSYPQIGHVHGGKSIQQRLGMVIAGRLRWRQWGSGDGPGAQKNQKTCGDGSKPWYLVSPKIAGKS